MMDTAPLGVEIAGINFSIHLPLEAWRAVVAARYAAFLAPVAPGWTVVVHYDPALADPEAPWIRHEAAMTTYHLLGQTGELDLETRWAQVSTSSEVRAAGALDRTLAYICMQVLPREHDGLLLHAAGVEIDGAGHVFTGASGAGKTTVARLAAGRGQVLVDENVILRLGAGGPEVYSTPFWGHSTPPALIQRTNRHVPLAAIYLLVHAPEFRLSRLSPSQAAVALLSTEKVATERAESAAAWLAVAERLIAQVPIHHLAFRPTVELWDFLAPAGDSVIK